MDAELRMAGRELIVTGTAGAMLSRSLDLPEPYPFTYSALRAAHKRGGK